MIARGLHDSTDEPPAVPAFHCGDRAQEKESICRSSDGSSWGNTEVCALKKTLEAPPTEQISQESRSLTHVWVSLGKAADLRMSNLEQLCYLQDQELAEPKRTILDALQELS